MVSVAEIRASGRWVAVLGFALVGCAQEDDEFTFSRADMEDAALGTWTGTWAPTDGAPTELTLQVRPPDAPAREAACGNRNFSSSSPGQHAQCVRISSLFVSATLTLADGSMDPLMLEGSFEALGTDFNSGSLDLNYAMPPFGIWAEWTSGRWQRCEARGAPTNDEPGGAVVASCSLDSRE